MDKLAAEELMDVLAAEELMDVLAAEELMEDKSIADGSMSDDPASRGYIPFELELREPP